MALIGKLLLAGTASLVPLLLATGCPAQPAADDGSAVADVLAGRLRWRVGAPLVAPVQSLADTYHSVKDPSVVFHDGRWHLFCSVRGQNRSHQIEYLSFADWADTAAGHREMPRHARCLDDPWQSRATASGREQMPWLQERRYSSSTTSRW